jgi:mono/diheme cytochrome c family protein
MKNLIHLTLLIFALGFSFAMTGCGPNGNSPNVELIQDMMESPSVKAQEYDDFFKDDHAGGARVPPEGTVPVGFKPYHIGFDPEKAKGDKNPFAGSADEQVLLTGQKFFETNCMVCHGMKGDGHGTVSEKMPNKPPALISDKIKGWQDGQIYQVITMGQGTMGSYASHIPQKYRWQVVNYIRRLQKDSLQK